MIQNSDDKIKVLYNAVSKDYDLGTESEFRTKLQDMGKRKVLFEAIGTEYDLGSFDDFSSKIDSVIKPIISPEEKARQQAIPSFRDFATKNNIPVAQQRAAAEGVYSPKLAMKVQQDYDVATAPERKQQKLEKEAKTKEEALYNTTIKKLNSEGIKFKDGDVVFKKALEDTRKAVEDDLLALTSINGKPEYLRKLGLVKSIVTTFKETNRQRDLSKTFYKASEDEQIRIADEENKREVDGIPSGIRGMIGESLSMGIVPYSKAIVGGAVGTGLLPGAGTLAGIIGGIAANTEDAYKQGYMSEVVKRYNQDISDMEAKGIQITQDTKRAAMKRAKELGATAGVLEAGVVAGLSSIPFGNSIAGGTLKNSVKQMIKHSTFDAGRQMILGTSAELVKGKIASAKGYNIDEAEEFENALNRGGQEFQLGLAMNVMTNVSQFPKYVQSAAKNYLSSIPRPDFNNMSSALEAQGAVPVGTTEKINSQLDAFQEARAKVPNIVPEEDAPSFAGLVEKKTNLENQKKTADKSMHPKIDEQIEAVDTRIQKMMESADPIKEEVDNLTGATGDAPAYTDAKIQEDIDVVYGKPKAETIAEKVSDAEYEAFIDKGIVPQDRIQSIANKVKDNQPLSERETAIFSAKTKDVNMVLEAVRAKEVAAEPVVETPKPLTRVQIARELARLDYPVDAYGIALKALAEGRVVNKKSFQDETGFKSEASSSGFVEKRKGKQAPSIEALSENLWEDFVPDEMKQDITNDQIRDKLIEVIGQYKNKTEAARAFVESYSAEVKAREEEAAMSAALAAEDVFVVENDIAYLTRDYNKWMSEVGEIEQAARLTDEYIKTIIEDEKRVTEASKGIAGAEPAKRAEEVIGDVITKETREVVGEYIKRQGTDAEISDFSEYTNRELSRTEFDAEYNANRRAGETKEEFILRKYCK